MDFLGIDPGPYALRKERVEYPIIRSVCKECGIEHGMCVEVMATGELIPLDLCKNCLFFTTYKPITEQITISELVEVNLHDSKWGDSESEWVSRIKNVQESLEKSRRDFNNANPHLPNSSLPVVQENPTLLHGISNGNMDASF
jgi:hypothetical protein